MAANLECAVTAEEEKVGCLCLCPVGRSLGDAGWAAAHLCARHPLHANRSRLHLCHTALSTCIPLRPQQDEERAFNFKLHPSNLPALK